jgi:hypothetical protein
MDFVVIFNFGVNIMDAFNLKRALAGAKLITRGGYTVENFRHVRAGCIRNTSHKYSADVCGIERTFTGRGRWSAVGNISEFDLFIDNRQE